MKKIINAVSLIMLLALILTLMPPQALAQAEIACESDVVVQADDWLSKIAEKVYGDVTAYQAIADATNTKAASDDSYAQVDNVNVIEPGWKLCIPASGDVEAMLQQSAAAQAASSDQELVIAIAQDIGALDIRKEGSAASFSLLRHIYEPLVWFDDGMQLYPLLAESWEQIDPTTMRFKLRQGVTFHNGNPFNAEAVKYSLDKVLDPNFPAWMNFALVDLVKEAKVVDDYTVDIITVAPTPSLLWRLTLLDMVDPTYADTPEMDTSPNGTGPYKFVEFTPSQQFVLERNDAYWGDKSNFKKVTARIIPEAGTRLAALLAGEVQMINAVSPEMLEQINASDNATVSTAPTARLVYVSMRNDRPPLDNVKVRQALNYAIDKQTIVDTILQDIAVVAKSPLPPSLRSARSDLAYPYDPEKAKQLLAEAGYAGEEIIFAVGAGRYPNDDQVGQAIAAYMQDVGLNVKFEQGEWATFNTENRKGKESPFDAFFQGWSADALDPVLMLTFLFKSENTESRTSYANPAVDELVSEAALTNDPTKLDDLLNEAQGTVWDDAPFIFMYIPKEVLGVSSNLKGFSARPDEFFFFNDAYFAQ
jgi:peptide/nickel transport system substrate-binding protein